MSLDYTVREFKDEDEPQILKLLEKVFKREHTRESWRWKYFDNPLKKHVIVVAEIDDHIIGCNHAFCREIKFGKNLHLMSFGGAAAVHPDYRRMGIHSKMHDMLEDLRNKEGFNLAMAVTINPVVKNRMDKHGWLQFPKNIIESIYIENIDKTEMSSLKKAGYQVYKSIRQNLKPEIGNVQRYVVKKVTQFGAEADVFWEKIEPHYCFLFKRDTVTLNWRYCDSRTAPYKVFSVIDQGELLGYCVIIVRESSGEKTGYIIDLITSPRMNDVVNILLQKAVEVLKKEVNVIKYWAVEGHSVLPVFHSFGFMSRPSNLEFRYRHSGRINNDLERVISATKNTLFIQYGDTDFT
jgi:GNAT superfamily N-acetyltransferase